MRYTVHKEKGSNKWICYDEELKHTIPNSFTSKKKALKIVANLMNITLKEYLKIRKAVE